MYQNWLISLVKKSLVPAKNRKSRRNVSKVHGSKLSVQSLEGRVVPASIVFQQGATPTGASSAYAGTTQIRIDSSSPITNQDGATVAGGYYFLDGALSSDLTSPNQWDLIRFAGIFGSDPGQIPVGSVIRSATLQLRTATATENSSSNTGGPFGVCQMFVPFDATTTWASFGNGQNGPAYGIHCSFPTGAVRNSLTPTSVSLPLDSTTIADVTSAVASWSANPGANFGLLVRQINTSDGWGIKTIGNSAIETRPALNITYDPPPSGQMVTASFQQDVNGYSGNTSVWLQQSGTTTNGNALANPVFLDGYLPTDTGSPDDQMLIKFDGMFGNAPGQIPAGSTIVSAALVLSTGGVADSSSANSAGPWACSQVKVNWDTSVTYTSATSPFNLVGNTAPTHPTSRTATVANPGSSTSELKVLSNSTGITFDQKAVFDVTSAVQEWLAGTSPNYGLNVQANGTSDGWQIHFPGSSNTAARPRLVIQYTLPAASTEPASNSLDISNGTLSYQGGQGLANAVTVSLASGNYTISDSSGAISLAASAIAQGWTGSGSNTVTGPSSSVSLIIVSTGTGADTVTVSGADDALLIDAGGQSGDSVAFTGAVATANQNITVINANTITSTAGSLLDVGTGKISLSAITGVGTEANPILTKAGRIALVSGNGGAFVNEADGAVLTAEIGGTGALKIVNATGTLSNNLNEVIRTAQGALTLQSGDALTINGIIGISAMTGAGKLSMIANADGSGDQGYSQGLRGGFATTGDVDITVNTTGGGTASATLGYGQASGTLTVTSNSGNILWNPNYTIPADTAGTNLVTLAARNYTFTTTATAGSIGNSASPIQVNNGGTADQAGNSVARLSAGTGGIFLTDWGTLDLTVGLATAAGGGNIVLKTANGALNNLILTGSVTTGSGSITLQSDDDLRMNSGSSIGGAGFSGTVTIAANKDGGGEQRFVMDPAVTIVTSNSTSSAVSITATGTDTNVTNATIGGADLAGIQVGNGGTITVDVAPGATSLQGSISQAASTLLDAGANGRVALNARSLLNGAVPATGAGIGTAASPIRTNAGIVTATSTNGVIFVVEADGATMSGVVTGPGALNFSSTTGQIVVGGSTNTDGDALTLTASGTGGGITVNSALGDSNTGNITLDAGTNHIVFNTAFTTNSGQTVTLIDGSSVDLGVTTTTNGVIVAANGVKVGPGATLAGTGSVTGPVNVKALGTISPAGSLTSVFGIGNLKLDASAIASLTLNSTTPGTGHDQLNVTGTVDLSGSQLRLNIGTGISLGASYTIITNDGTDPVVGTFIGGTTIRSFNNPLVEFTINYAGGDGNDVVATVSSISSASGLLDVNGNQVLYYSNVGITNNVTLAISDSRYSLTEGAGNITLTPAAVTAGWSGGGTGTVTGPTTGVAGITLGLSDGNDILTNIAGGTASVSVNGLGNLTVAGPVTTQSTFNFDEFSTVTVNASVTAGTGINVTGLNPLTFAGTGSLTATAGNILVTRFGNMMIGSVGLNAPAGTITFNGSAGTTTTLNTLTATANTVTFNGADTVNVNGNFTASSSLVISGVKDLSAAASSLLRAATITLTASNSIGTIANPILTQTTTIAAGAGSGGIVIKELDGANVTASATGTGDINISSTSGMLTIASPTATAAGSMTFSSGDGVSVNANLGTASTSGAITINANTDGAGSEGFTQSTSANIRTSNTTSGLTIKVNTASGGTGNALLGTGQIGSSAGGGVVVDSNRGSILWNPAFGTISAGTLPNPVGGSNSQTLQARNYSFTTTGSGSIGTLDTPIQTDNYASSDATVNNSIATLSAGTGGIYLSDWGSADLTIGSAIATGGNIQIFSANAGGHNLFVSGTVNTANGNIVLAADDDLRIQGATIGGATFAGTITLFANRDNGNEQRILMDGTSSIVTTNASSSALGMFVTSTDNDPSNATLGGVTLGNVTVGNGGTVTIDAANGLSYQGNIIQILGTRIDAGTTGTVVLRARNSSNGSNPAVGAGILFDLDGAGVNTGPLQVRAGTVNITAVNTNVNVAEGNPTFTDANGFNSTATVTGFGYLTLASDAGPINVAGATNTDGGAISITASGAGGGVSINGALGDANTGDIRVDGGTQTVAYSAPMTVAAGRNTTLISGNVVNVGPSPVLNVGGTIVAANGIQIPASATLVGSGTVNGPVSVLANGTLSPGIVGLGAINTGSLSLAANSALTLDINGTGVGQFDSVAVTGAVNVTGALLRLNVNANLAVGNSFVIIANDGTDSVVGQFVGGTGVTAYNDARYQFTVNYAGGDGNDVVVTVSNILPTIVDVFAGTLLFSTGSGINNSLAVTLLGGNYTFTDTATPIFLTSGAVSAGWTSTDPNTVTGPATGITAMSLALNDGTDTLAGLNSGVNVQIIGTGSLTVSGPLTVTGALSTAGQSSINMNAVASATTGFSITNVGTINSNSSGLLASPSVTLAASNAIGSAANNLRTQATTVIASSGTGGIAITELDGASFTVNATGSGNIALNNLVGELIIGGSSSTAQGNISLTSADAVTVNADLGTALSLGTITILANTDGTGSESFSQASTALISTGNATSSALAITVNTASGGNGNAVLGVGSIGNASGGTATVSTNAGSILWGPTIDISGSNNPEGGSNLQTLKARDYIFSCSGSASIGTAVSPIQTDNYSSADGVAGSTAPNGLTGATLTAGSGGIYLSDWGGSDFVLKSALTSGSGNIQIFAANAGGHNMFVTGPVVAATGSIFLAADDDFYLSAGSVVGGSGFSGTVRIAGSRDKVNEQRVIMDSTASIETSNNSATAVVITDTATDNTPSDPTIGGVILANIKVGDGGTITIDAAPSASYQGQIIQQTGTKLDAGPTGSVILRARSLLSGVLPANGAGIGASAQPIAVTAANVEATSVNGSIYVAETDGASFTGIVIGPGDLSLSTLAGPLTMAGTSRTDSGSMNLTGAGGIVLNGEIGSSMTGAITLTGAVSGSAGITAGTGTITFSQTTDSTYSGAIAGTQNVVKGGNGSLRLTGTSPYTGTTAITGGSLIVDGSLSGTSSVSVVSGSTLGGNGSVAGQTSVAGRLAPGSSSPGRLTTGDLTLNSGANFALKINGTSAGIDYDQIKANGIVTLGSAALSVTTGFTASGGSNFVLIDNDGTDGVNGTFNGLAEGSSINVSGQQFTISYVGGTGNDVVLTKVSVPLPKVNSVVINDGSVSRSRVTTIKVTFNSIVNFAGAVASAFTLERINGGIVGGFSATSNTVNGVTVVTLSSFTGNQTYFGSLANGYFKLTVLANQVSNAGGQLDGNNSGTGGTDYVLVGSQSNKFFRYYGDLDGNASVDGDDLAIFVSTLFNPNNYVAALDYDNNGSIDGDDLALFVQNLFVPL